MAGLREVFEQLGHTNVRTYIQSGNVVFDAKGAAPEVRSALERAIDTTFGLDVTVLLRTPAELAKIRTQNPYGPEAYVTFLDGVPDRKRVAALDPAPFTPDGFRVIGQEVYLHCANGYGRTKINNTFFEKKLATRATTRNWRTVETVLQWATT
jgi:uncharacterized protein (DUF1697 family)